MKRILLILIFTASALTLWAAPTMTVQVSSAQLRDSPGIKGKLTAEVRYGEKVEVVEKGKGWIRVRTSSKVLGWLQESALTEKNIVLTSGKQVKSGASSREVALAGKGFSEDIEREYRSDADLEKQFRWVDRMEGFVRPEMELQAFLSDGELQGVVE
jgi:uncharacterized protein YgiM (DUF1202 family)